MNKQRKKHRHTFLIASLIEQTLFYTAYVFIVQRCNVRIESTIPKTTSRIISVALPCLFILGSEPCCVFLFILTVRICVWIDACNIFHQTPLHVLDEDKFHIIIGIIKVAS